MAYFPAIVAASTLRLPSKEEMPNIWWNVLMVNLTCYGANRRDVIYRLATLGHSPGLDEWVFKIFSGPTYIKQPFISKPKGSWKRKYAMDKIPSIYGPTANYLMHHHLKRNWPPPEFTTLK